MGRSKHRHHSNGNSHGSANGQSRHGDAPTTGPAPPGASPPVHSSSEQSTSSSDFNAPTQPETSATAVAADPHETNEQIEFLTSELNDRDQLVHALTAQLEEAVEQLDRLHRQGADRASRAGGSGGSVTADFIDEQRANNDRLNQWLDQWDQSQPFDLWARIEDRLGELASQFAGHGNSSTSGISSHHAPFAAPAAQQVHEPPAEQAPAASSWEETKQRLLGEMSFNFGDTAPASGSTTTTAASVEIPPISAADVEFPIALDFDKASREELCSAIEIRDKYISYLTHRLRASEMQQPVNWDALGQAPADLRQQLLDLEGRYSEHLRREECDMALERARLAREQARLQQDRTRLEHQMRRAGITADDNRPGSSAIDADDRSWLKMFGKKKN